MRAFLSLLLLLTLAAGAFTGSARASSCCGGAAQGPVVQAPADAALQTAACQRALPPCCAPGCDDCACGCCDEAPDGGPSTAALHRSGHEPVPAVRVVAVLPAAVLPVAAEPFAAGSWRSQDPAGPCRWRSAVVREARVLPMRD